MTIEDFETVRSEHDSGCTTFDLHGAGTCTCDWEPALDRIQAEVERLQADLVDDQVQLVRKDAEERLQRAYQTARQDRIVNEARAEGAEREVERLRESLLWTEVELEKAEAEVERLRDALYEKEGTDAFADSLASKLSASQAEVERLRAENEEYRIGHVPGPVLQTLREQNERLRADCDLHQGAINHYEAEVERLRAQIEERDRIIGEDQAEIERLKEK